MMPRRLHPYSQTGCSGVDIFFASRDRIFPALRVPSSATSVSPDRFPALVARLVAHPCSAPSILRPRRPRLAGASDDDEDRNTGNPAMAPLVWLVMGNGADRHGDGARRTVVVIGSGMVLVIMWISRKAGADRLRDSANAWRSCR